MEPGLKALLFHFPKLNILFCFFLQLCFTLDFNSFVYV